MFWCSYPMHIAHRRLWSMSNVAILHRMNDLSHQPTINGVKIHQTWPMLIAHASCLMLMWWLLECSTFLVEMHKWCPRIESTRQNSHFHRTRRNCVDQGPGHMFVECERNTSSLVRTFVQIHILRLPDCRYRITSSDNWNLDNERTEDEIEVNWKCQ